MFVDAKLIDGHVFVSSYDSDGNRSVSTHRPPYVYYYPDRFGSFTSVYGDKLKRAQFYDRNKFQNELKKHKNKGVTTFESDVSPVFRLLEEQFPTSDTPPLKISILDIECDKDPVRGWSQAASPYAIVNAITIYNKWEDQYYTLSVAPPNMTREEARALLDSTTSEDEFGGMTEEHGYFVCESEGQLLAMTLEIIENADVISGWNSALFDLPYLIQRVRIVFGGERVKDLEREGQIAATSYKTTTSDYKKVHTVPFKPSPDSIPWLQKFNLAGFPCLPEMHMVEHFGHMEKTFRIFGRVHIDYLELYRKFTFEELHSYALDFILELEVNQNKVAYKGSLDQLYRNDFRTFIAYSRQDVAGLVAMDDKLKMIELANTMAHMAGVTFDKVLGSVAIIEQAILRELHKKNQICFDKNIDSDAKPVTVPGGFVVDPHKGIYEWIASFDINSLYPSVIRSLNISPECVVGQFKLDRTEEKYDRHINQGLTPTEAWGKFTGVLEYHSVIDETNDMVTCYMEDAKGGEVSATGKEWKEQLRVENWAVSANGTVFDLAQEGIVPFCLTKWYAQRQEWQGEKKIRKAAQDGAEGDTLAQLKSEEQYYDMIQLVMKIFLNSTYGALLNRFCRFYDPRLGKSVTLTSRVITKHMCRYASDLMTGNYDFDRRVIIYGDTDSAYTTLDWYMGEKGIAKTSENAIALADQMGEDINESFPAFMDANCLVGIERGQIIKAGRELVGRRGLFKDVKKRYAIHMVDYEGFTPKPGKEMKITGMEVRRSDTPKFVQKFLTDAISAVVMDNKSYDDLNDMVQDFREEFRAMDPWRRGTPCRVNNLTTNTKKVQNYEEECAEGYVDLKKPRIHFSVAAAINTNLLMEQFGEHRWDVIRDGDKIEVLVLRPNQYDLKSVAIKVGETHVPEWFMDLPFDNEIHEHKLIDKKLHNMIGVVLDWTFEPVGDHQQEVFEEVDFFA
jgi:DNA polymerase elongation subunit (family B)